MTKLTPEEKEKQKKLKAEEKKEGRKMPLLN